MYDFLTIGGATRDTFFEISDGRIMSDPDHPGQPKLLGFEYGSKIVPEKAFFSYGGGAINTSVCLSKMGFSVAGCLRVGPEGTGDILLRDIKEHGVDWRFVERDPVTHTALSVIIEVPGADRVIFQYPGANSNLEIDNLDDIRTGWIYLTSLTGKSVELLPRIEKKTVADNIKLVFNPGETQLKTGFKNLQSLIKSSYVLLLNREEAAHLVVSENPGEEAPEIEELFAAACGWGPRYVVITDGTAGSYACDGSSIYFLPAYPAETQDMTGAGDSYGAGLVCGLIRYDGAVDKAMALAAANAASVVSQHGAHRGSLSFQDAEAIVGRNSGPGIKTMEMT
jgi:sugar/nucleoside kinase (ribokinase family)